MIMTASARALVVGVTAIVVLAQQPAGAFDHDLHFYFTYYVARVVGFTSLQAERIARANSMTDFGATDAKLSQANRIGFHAFVDATAEAKDRATLVDAREASLLANAATIDNPGLALHFIQDRYAHADYDSIDGHLFDGTYPDFLSLRPDRARQAAGKTVLALSTFIGRCCKDQALSTPDDQVAAVLEELIQNSQSPRRVLVDPSYNVAAARAIVNNALQRRGFSGTAPVFNQAGSSTMARLRVDFELPVHADIGDDPAEVSISLRSTDGPPNQVAKAVDAVTLANGNRRVTGQAAGTYTVTLSAEGFKDRVIDVVNDGRPLTSVTLERATADALLDPEVVVFRRAYELLSKQRADVARTRIALIETVRRARLKVESLIAGVPPATPAAVRGTSIETVLADLRGGKDPCLTAGGMQTALARKVTNAEEERRRYDFVLEQAEKAIQACMAVRQDQMTQVIVNNAKGPLDQARILSDSLQAGAGGVVVDQVEQETYLDYVVRGLALDKIRVELSSVQIPGLAEVDDADVAQQVFAEQYERVLAELTERFTAFQERTGIDDARMTPMRDVLDKIRGIPSESPSIPPMGSLKADLQRIHDQRTRALTRLQQLATFPAAIRSSAASCVTTLQAFDSKSLVERASRAANVSNRPAALVPRLQVCESRLRARQMTELLELEAGLRCLEEAQRAGKETDCRGTFLIGTIAKNIEELRREIARARSAIGLAPTVATTPPVPVSAGGSSTGGGNSATNATVDRDGEASMPLDGVSAAPARTAVSVKGEVKVERPGTNQSDQVNPGDRFAPGRLFALASGARVRIKGMSGFWGVIGQQRRNRDTTARLTNDRGLWIDEKAGGKVEIDSSPVEDIPTLMDGLELTSDSARVVQINRPPQQFCDDRGSDAAGSARLTVEIEDRGLRVAVIEGGARVVGVSVVRTNASFEVVSSARPVQTIDLNAGEFALSYSREYLTQAAPRLPGLTAPAVTSTASGSAIPNLPGLGAPATRPASPLAAPDPWNNPQIQGLIDEWLRTAQPVFSLERPGARFSEWGVMLVPGAAAVAPPSHPAGWSRHQTVWSVKDRLDSINVCYLGEFVERRVTGRGLEDCMQAARRRAAVAPSVAPAPSPGPAASVTPVRTPVPASLAPLPGRLVALDRLPASAWVTSRPDLIGKTVVVVSRDIAVTPAIFRAVCVERAAALKDVYSSQGYVFVELFRSSPETKFDAARARPVALGNDIGGAISKELGFDLGATRTRPYWSYSTLVFDRQGRQIGEETPGCNLPFDNQGKK